MKEPSLTYASEKVEEFWKSLNPVTRQSYGYQIPLIVPGDLPEFIYESMKDSEYADKVLIDYISKEKENSHLSNQTIRAYVAAVKSLLSWCNIPYNQRKIIRILPKKTKPQDRPPSIEEIRKLYEILDLRGKSILLFMVSSGIRVGAFDYLCLRDLTELEGFGRLVVYRGEPEEYETFVSDECMKIFKEYLKQREASGEKLKPESPLIRRAFALIQTESKSKRGQYFDYGTGRAGATAIMQHIDDNWARVRVNASEFKNCHGFRKFYKTTLENSALKTVYIERLLGHSLKTLEGSYNKVTTEDLGKLYKTYMHLLYISQVPQLKDEIEKAKVESGKVTSLEMQVRELTSQLAQARQETHKYKEFAESIDERVAKEVAKLWKRTYGPMSKSELNEIERQREEDREASEAQLNSKKKTP
jgi:integrase